MAEALIVAAGVVAGVDWRLLTLAAGAVWAPLPSAAAVLAAVVAGTKAEGRSRVGSEMRFVETAIGELRAGGSPRAALRAACAERPEAAPVVRRLDVGEPLPRAVEGLAPLLPSIGELVETAVVMGGGGGRLLPVFEELMVHAVAQDSAAAEVRTAVAPVRASMAVLVGAPVLYLVWSVVTGRLGRLLARPGGAWLAVIGAALFLAGVVTMLLLWRRRAGARRVRRVDGGGAGGQRRAVGVVAAGAVGVIVAGVPGGLVAAIVARMGLRIRRRRPASPDGIDVAARLLVLIGTGLPLMAALEAASSSLPGVEAVARRARRLGSAAALASASGPLAPLMHRLADAAASGAPPEPALRAYIDVERRRRQTEAVERARRLPVRLMVPMTLLVLPGFVLMVYGPAFIDLVVSLLGPLTG